MKTLLYLPLLLLASCQDRPQPHQEPTQDTIAAPAAYHIDSLTSKLFHAPVRPERMAAARGVAPAFTLASDCEDGIFRLWLVCQRDIAGNVGSIAVTLQADEAIAGSQLDGSASPLQDVSSDFNPPVVDFWTGGRRVTFFSARGVNQLFGTDLTAPGSFTQVIEGGAGQYREFKGGERYLMLTGRYDKSLPDGWLHIATSGGLTEQLGASWTGYVAVGANNEVEQ